MWFCTYWRVPVSRMGYSMGTAAAGHIFSRGDATLSCPCSHGGTIGCSGVNRGPACLGRVLRCG